MGKRGQGGRRGVPLAIFLAPAFRIQGLCYDEMSREGEKKGQGGRRKIANLEDPAAWGTLTRS